MSALLVLAAAFAAVYGPVFARLVHNWAFDSNYSHGFLVLPLVLYLAWQRREALAGAVVKGSALGLVIIAGSLALLVGGVLGAEVFLTRVSMVAAIAGAVLFVYGRQHLAIVALPLVLLLLTIPIPALVFNQIALPLQLLASRLGVIALWCAGVPALREGNLIVLAHGTLEVADACSGIRSLMALVTLAVVYGHFVDRRPGIRAALVVLAVPVAVLVNGVRVGVTGLLEEGLGAQWAADGFFHAFSGWLMFLAAFGLLVAAHRLLASARRMSWSR